MEDFESVYKKVSQHIRDAVVKSDIQYPRTQNLDKDIPEETFEIQSPEIPNYEELRQHCQSSINLQALDGIEDIIYIVDTLSRVHNQMLLSRVDCVQIWKGGVDLLKIVMKGNNTGRSAFIEINSLRLKLMNYLKEKEYTEIRSAVGGFSSFLNSPLVASLLTASVLIFLAYWKK